jgi:hypothetical protein
MISFRNQRAVSFELDYMDVLWEVAPTTEDIQEYQFFVERSEAEAGPWLQIAGPMVDTYRFRDNTVPQITTNARTIFYRVKAVHLPTGRIQYSPLFDQEGKISLLAQEMVRRERVLFEEFVGTKCWVFPRRTFGQKCPSCYDPVMDKIIDDACSTCWSTGFSGGYHYPIEFWAQIDAPEQTEQVSLEDHRRVLYYQLRCGPAPALKPLDLVIDYQNRRHRVVSVSGTSRLGVTVRQEVRLVQIQRGSIEDRVPLNIDTASLKPFPEREFTNPHSLESSETDLASLFNAYGYRS